MPALTAEPTTFIDLVMSACPGTVIVLVLTGLLLSFLVGLAGGTHDKSHDK